MEAEGAALEGLHGVARDALRCRAPLVCVRLLPGREDGSRTVILTVTWHGDLGANPR